VVSAAYQRRGGLRTKDYNEGAVMGRIPGPTCTDRLGAAWIDEGTMCRLRTSEPGLTGVVETFFVHYKWKDVYDKGHVYSTAPEATRKYAIDLQIMGGDYRKGGDIRLDSEAYLKRLIELASGGRKKVGVVGGKAKARLQFFIIRGGAEGFLPGWLSGQNASDVITPGATVDGKKGRTFRFDHNDVLAVFDGTGKLISSARLERPLSITGKWTQKTAEKVYNAWDGKEVFVYRNARPGWIPYLGLGIEDGMRGRKATVDLHKQEATNGCIFIVDPNTPAMDDSNLGTFEPKLITDILASLGRRAEDTKGRVSLGVMHTVEIK
jgi:hypothetical protein